MSPPTAIRLAAAKPVRPIGARSGSALRCACGAEKSALTGACPECFIAAELPRLAKPRVDDHNDRDDALEREAERIANAVVGGPAVDARLPVRSIRHAPRVDSPALAPASVGKALVTRGTPLEPSLRTDLEQRLGHDLSAVRVHVGAAAEESARELHADAYTLGHDIVFGAGRFAPETLAGKQLLAHELVHVVQQTPTAGDAAHAGRIQRSPRDGNEANDAKRESGTADLTPLEPVTTAGDLDTVEEPAPAPATRGVDADAAGAAAAKPDARRPVPPQKLGPPAAAPVIEEIDAGAAANDADAQVEDSSQPAPTTTAPGAGDETSLPRLWDMLPQRRAVASVEGPAPATTTENVPPTSGVADFVAATPDEVTDFVTELRGASNDAGQRVAGYASDARASLVQRSTAVNDDVADDVKLANAIVSQMIGKRRGDLERTIVATQTSIDWQRDIRQQEAETHGQDAKLEMAHTVSKQRGKIERSIVRWVGYVETLREFHTKRIKDAVAENAQEAVGMAERYDRRYISLLPRGPERAAVMREASALLAKALADEFRKVEPQTIAALNESTRGMAGAIHEYGDKALAEFDETLPPLLNGIDAQVAAAKTDIADKARDAHARLAEPVRAMRARLDDLEKETLAHNASIGVDAARRIKSGRADADAQYRRAVPRVMQPIAGTVDEAIEILTTEEALDLDASWQFVDEVTGFARGASEASAELFAEARSGVDAAFERPVPVTRRALRATRKQLADILRDEGTQAELDLVDFETRVDDSYGASVAMLDETFATARSETTRNLAPFAREVELILEKGVMDAAPQLRQAVNDALYEQILGLRRLKKAMHQAALEAAWRFDHPKLKHVVDAIEWVAEVIAVIFVAIAIIVTLILALKAIVGLLAIFVGKLIAEAIVVLVGSFLLGYFGAQAYDERKQKKQSSFVAFFGALGDITGINEIRRVFTDSSMGIMERGFRLGMAALSIFGLAMGTARVFKAIRLRFPSRITDPRGPAAPLPMPETPLPVEPPAIQLPPPIEAPIKPPTVVRGFRPAGGMSEPTTPAPIDVPGKPPTVVRGLRPAGDTAAPPTPAPIDVPGKPPTVVRGFQPAGKSTASPSPAPVPIEPPVKPPTRVRGFRPPGEKVEPPAPVDAPVMTSPSTGGFGRQPGQRVPVSGEAAQTAATPTRTLPPHEMPGGAAAPPAAQGARAAAPSPDVAPTSGPSTPTPSSPQPVKGHVEPATGAPKTTLSPPAGEPALPGRSRRMEIAEKRVAESSDIARKARDDLAKATQDVTGAERNLKEMRTLEPLKPGDKEFIAEQLTQLKADVRAAKASRKAARKAAKQAAIEADEVASAQRKMADLEREIARLDREMQDLTRDPKLVNEFGRRYDMPPPPGTTWRAKYDKLAKASMQAKRDLADSFGDVTRRIATQVRALTPGEPGKALALENATKLGDKLPVLRPVNDVPIDITTGNPIEGPWVADHLVARTTIAKDPRFRLLNRAGRVTMLRGIPENMLPITPRVNSSKLNRPVNEWIQSLARANKPLDREIADALREATEIAKKAIDAKFNALLGISP